ncbi:MAG: glycosyltransferase [Lachnospiraceae bacterium]|nr:glycosyltransferase [Lachnospiraceae bacterium]
MALGLIVLILKIYFIVLIVIMMIYGLRHIIFTHNRLYMRQKVSYRDVMDSDLPKVTVVIPMHNEEAVLDNVIESLLKCDYDWDRLEIIPINDHSTDRTGEMLRAYHARYPFIRPLHRYGDDILRGKPAGLNDAIALATGEVIIVFDADYRPSRNLLKKLATPFTDPEVGAVMGRVIPLNANHNLLTCLLNLERTGGYQVDQQARYNMGLVPQYGGTVGGFRRSVIVAEGGFDTKILAEDTELTYRLYTTGWTVVYDNSAECYEEAPETWAVRAKQIRRWARGHNEVMFKNFFRVIFTPYLSIMQKVDGMMLLLVYFMPFLLALGHIDCLILFFLGEMELFSGWFILLFIGVYNSWGNFAPFYEIGAGTILDGLTREILALPMLCFSFYFYMWHISRGFLDAVVDRVTRRNVTWNKTDRFAGKKGNGAASAPTDASAPDAATPAAGSADATTAGSVQAMTAAPAHHENGAPQGGQEVKA